MPKPFPVDRTTPTPKPSTQAPSSSDRASSTPGATKAKKSLAAHVRALVGADGSGIADQMWRIWSGQEPGWGKRDRMVAGLWLSDRGFGKSVDAAVLAAVEDSDGRKLPELATADLLAAIRALPPPQDPARIVDAIPAPRILAASNGDAQANTLIADKLPDGE